MSGLFHSWIMRLAGASILAACAMALTPEVRAKKAVRAVCALVTMLAFVYPLTEMKIGQIEDVFSDYRDRAQLVSSEIIDVNEKIMTDIIESETETYIWDKGKSFELELFSVDVQAKRREDGNFYPYSAEIEGRGDGGDIQSLKEALRSELGLEADKIYWRDAQ